MTTKKSTTSGKTAPTAIKPPAPTAGLKKGEQLDDDALDKVTGGVGLAAEHLLATRAQLEASRKS
jgi:hypothetical protein